MAQSVRPRTEHTHNMLITGMPILGWMRGQTLKDKIRNEGKMKYLGITVVQNKIRER